MRTTASMFTFTSIINHLIHTPSISTGDNYVGDSCDKWHAIDMARCLCSESEKTREKSEYSLFQLKVQRLSIRRVLLILVWFALSHNLFLRNNTIVVGCDHKSIPIAQNDIENVAVRHCSPRWAHRWKGSFSPNNEIAPNSYVFFPRLHFETCNKILEIFFRSNKLRKLNLRLDWFPATRSTVQRILLIY